MARRDLRKMFYLNTNQGKRLGIQERARTIFAIEVYYIGTGYPCGIHLFKNGQRTQIEVNLDDAIAVIPGLWNKLTKAELKECDHNPTTRRAK